MQCIDGVKGLAGVSWGQPKVKLLRNAIWQLGVIRGHPEGSCLEIHRAIKSSQCYRALCSCRCSSLYNNKHYFLFVWGWVCFVQTSSWKQLARASNSVVGGAWANLDFLGNFWQVVSYDRSLLNDFL